MSYLGKTGLNHANIKRWTGTPGVTDSILFSTLGFTPFNEQSCIITVNGVKQHDTSFVLTGTRILFSTNLSVTDEVEIIAILSVGLPLRPSDNSVQRKHLVSDLRNITQDKFSGNASTTAFTLSYAPYSASSVLVFLNGVSQLAGTDYTVSSVTLTFTTPPVTGTDNINVIHLVYATGTAEVIPPDNSITAPKLAIGAVTKVYNGSDIKLSSTSTGIDVTGDVTADGLTIVDRIDQRWPSGVAHTNLHNAIVGVTNGFQTTQDASNNLTYTFNTGANATALKITSTGNVGIGTTLPTEAKLVIDGGADGSSVVSGRSDGGIGNNARFTITAFADGGGAGYGGGIGIQTRSTTNVFSERMRIDSSGIVTTPSQPAFSAGRNAGTVTGGTYICNTEQFDRGNIHNQSNGRFTAPITGVYYVSVFLMSNNQNTYNNKRYYIFINGVEYRQVYGSNGGNLHHQWNWAGAVSLSANDYMSIEVDANMELYGGDEKYSTFSAFLVG